MSKAHAATLSRSIGRGVEQTVPSEKPPPKNRAGGAFRRRRRRRYSQYSSAKRIFQNTHWGFFDGQVDAGRRLEKVCRASRVESGMVELDVVAPRLGLQIVGKNPVATERRNVGLDYIWLEAITAGSVLSC